MINYHSAVTNVCRYKSLEVEFDTSLSGFDIQSVLENTYNEIPIHLLPLEYINIIILLELNGFVVKSCRLSSYRVETIDNCPILTIGAYVYFN